MECKTNATPPTSPLPLNLSPANVVYDFLAEAAPTQRNRSHMIPGFTAIRLPLFEPWEICNVASDRDGMPPTRLKVLGAGRWVGGTELEHKARSGDKEASGGKYRNPT